MSRKTVNHDNQVFGMARKAVEKEAGSLGRKALQGKYDTMMRLNINAFNAKLYQDRQNGINNHKHRFESEDQAKTHIVRNAETKIQNGCLTIKRNTFGNSVSAAIDFLRGRSYQIAIVNQF